MDGDNLKSTGLTLYCFATAYPLRFLRFLRLTSKIKGLQLRHRCDKLRPVAILDAKPDSIAKESQAIAKESQAIANESQAISRMNPRESQESQESQPLAPAKEKQ